MNNTRDESMNTSMKRWMCVNSFGHGQTFENDMEESNLGPTGTNDDFHGLVPSFRRDWNLLVCKIIPYKTGQTRITIAAEQEDWAKELYVSGGILFGKSIFAGNDHGTHMKSPNDEVKYSYVDIPQTEGEIIVQFLKAKTFGRMCDYGSTTFSGKDLNGKNVVFFWPMDSPGDGRKNFVNVLNGIHEVLTAIKDVADDCIALGKDGTELAAMFA